MVGVSALARQRRWTLSGQGRAAGLGRGHRLGSAGEFQGYRPYEPGDDLRHLDLRVFARRREAVVRVSREDSTLPVTLVIDRSASMAGKDREFACENWWSFLVELCRQRGDSVRVFGFQHDELSPCSMSARSWPPAAGPTNYERVFRQLKRDPHGRGVVLVLSDGWSLREPERALAMLARVALPFWIAPLTADELRPQLQGPVRLQSMEDEPRWWGHAGPDTLDEYGLRLRRYHAALRSRLRRHGGDFFAVDASRSFVEQLQQVVHVGSLLR